MIMTNEEFSNEFDILINSNSYKPFGLASMPLEFDEYEKSIFLTKAQEAIVTELYSGRNVKGNGFEETEELRSNLRSLLKTNKLDKEEDETLTKTSSNSKFFKIPSDCLYITFESASIDDDKAGCLNGSLLTIIPITQDEYHRVRNNPFRQANERRAIRLDYNQKYLEVISNYNIKDYTIKYVSKPSPIILIDLEGGLKINNLSNKCECNLDSSIHRMILDRAVILAYQSRVSQSKS